MYYTGLIPKYKVGRPLTKGEKEAHLPQDKALGLEPTSALSITKMNSTFLEVADKYYPWKGLWTVIMLFALSMALFMIFTSAYTAFIEHWPRYSRSERVDDILFIVFVVFWGGCIIAGSIWGLRKESFSYTHYPIRLNRKNRKVYVFRLDGTVLETSWDALFITISPSSPSSLYADGWDLRAHVLEPDGETVKETFAFGYVSDPDNLRHHFEYLRLYMDEGPKAIAPYTLDCLDIVDRKETAWFGFKRLWVNPNGLLPIQIALLPVFIPSAIGRAIAMRTCKIPRWPVEVEAACPIERGDPWARDASTHPAK